MIFEHIYNGYNWHCVPANNYIFIEIGGSVRSQFGRRGTDWRYQLVKPNKNNLTLLKLSNLAVPRYNLIYCFMFKTESDAEKMLQFIREIEAKVS